MFLCTFLLVHHTSSPYASWWDIDTMMFISIDSFARDSNFARYCWEEVGGGHTDEETE